MLEGGEPLAEPERVGRADGKDSDAALGAAGTAEEMRAAARRGVGEGAVYESDKGVVLLRERARLDGFLSPVRCAPILRWYRYAKDGRDDPRRW